MTRSSIVNIRKSCFYDISRFGEVVENHDGSPNCPLQQYINFMDARYQLECVNEAPFRQRCCGYDGFILDYPEGDLTRIEMGRTTNYGRLYFTYEPAAGYIIKGDYKFDDGTTVDRCNADLTFTGVSLHQNISC